MQMTTGTIHCPLYPVPCTLSFAQLHKSKIKKLHSPCVIVSNHHKTNSPGIYPTVPNARICSQTDTLLRCNRQGLIPPRLHRRHRSQQAPRIRMFRPGQHLADSPSLHNLAMPHNRHTASHLSYNRQVM